MSVEERSDGKTIERLTVAIEAQRRGDFKTAEAVLREVLDAEPENADALHFFGLLHYQTGQSDKAIELIERSLAVNPLNPSAQNNLGNILRLERRFAEAAKAYLTTLELDPANPDALSNAGLMLRRAGHADAAVESFHEAVRIAPRHYEAWHNLGITLVALGRREEAADAFETAVEVGDTGKSHLWLSQLLCSLGRREAACRFFERRLQLDPDDAVAAHYLAALRGQTPERASDAYVRSTFDGFSETFDEVLQDLDYKAPEFVAGAVSRRLGDNPPLADVVDLGCGTGLCGLLIRAQSQRLVGVDLSVGMLRKAHARGVYDELLEGDLILFLQVTPPKRFDLAVCADTLCYVGGLGPVMNGLTGALKPGGAMIATVEKLDEADEAGFRIGQSGRFMHTEAHLRQTAESAGLSLLRVEEVPLRKEMGKDVGGLLFEVELPGAPG